MLLLTWHLLNEETSWQGKELLYLDESDWSNHQEDVRSLLHHKGMEEHVGTLMTFISVSQYSGIILIVMGKFTAVDYEKHVTQDLRYWL